MYGKSQIIPDVSLLGVIVPEKSGWISGRIVACSMLQLWDAKNTYEAGSGLVCWNKT